METRRTRDRGELESLIMRVLWHSPSPLTARDIQASCTDNTPAITTVLTVLERLRAKGLVRRSEQRGGITFSATQSESEHAVAAMLTSLTAASDRQAALLHFAGNLDAEDAELLRAALAQQPARRRR